ncbi:hypothetical protein F511_39006 [Dorcoceras hygrometricum]|uniref:Uncharacterized protein n=1 Tax=Dorcoceras hygrometricum TaxID=472368 RepID=A0A2Z7BD62_9LAMI|nr:hypothetical protein F511_39006 [Dorcoceras hygrometricum]
MSLFDLQDVCIAIGSITTLDLPMVVDLIGIYGLKGPYCMLTTTKWFLQALSVIPRGSWADVARRSYHDPMGMSEIVIPEPQWLIRGIVIPVVDRIGGSTAAYSLKCRFPRETGRSQEPRRQQDGIRIRHRFPNNNQTYMRHDSDIFRRAFYRKMDEVVTSVITSQTALETSIVHQFTESQQQIASDLDFVKLQLAELINHFKDISDAKKGKQRAAKRDGCWCKRRRFDLVNSRDLLNVYIISDVLRISSSAYVDFRCWLVSTFCCAADVNVGQSSCSGGQRRRRFGLTWGTQLLTKRRVLGISCWSHKTITVEGSVALIYPAAGFVDQLLTARMTYPIRRHLVALDSSREALSFYTTLGGCSWIERDRKVAVLDHVFVRAVWSTLDVNGIFSVEACWCGFTSWSEISSCDIVDFVPDQMQADRDNYCTSTIPLPIIALLAINGNRTRYLGSDINSATTQGDDQNALPAKESMSWFDLPFELARRYAEGLLSSDTDEDLDQLFSEIETAGRTDGTVSAEQNLELVDKEGPATKAAGSMHTTEEHMSIDDLFMQISEDMMLPSVIAADITKIRLGGSINIHEVQERDLYYASLHRISIHDKGKEKLEGDEPSFVVYFQDTDVQNFSDFEDTSSDGSTVYCSPSPLRNESLALGPTSAQEEQLYIAESPESPPSIPQRQESSSSSSDSQMHFDSNDFPLDDTTEVQTSLPAATVDLSSLLDDLKSSLSQRMDDAHSEILSRLHTIERALQNTLGNQNEYFRNLIQSARQEGQNHDDLKILRLNELKKSVMAERVTTDTESLALRNRFNALDAKILLLDGQVAAIRSEQLEFQAKISADLLSLSTQIGELVDYIRGGDAKKGEGSSSRPQPPPSDVQGQGSGGNPGEGSGPTTVRLTDIADRIREDDRRQMEAERDRERQRRIRRLSSG